jgi:hypothetical protein
MLSSILLFLGGVVGAYLTYRTAVDVARINAKYKYRQAVDVARIGAGGAAGEPEIPKSGK